MKRYVSILLTAILLLSVLTTSVLAVGVAGEAKDGQATEASEAAQTGLATGKGEDWQEVLDDQKLAEQENGISPQANEILITDKHYYSSNSPDIKVNGYSTNSGAWVGLYTLNAAVSSKSIAWYYCADVSGYVSLKTGSVVKWNTSQWNLATGAYKVVLFGDSGYSNVMATRYVFVGPATVSTNKSTYCINEPILVSTNYNQWEGWVGMHKSGVTPGSGNSVSSYYPVTNNNMPGMGLSNVNIIGSSSGIMWGNTAYGTGTFVIGVFEHSAGYNRIASKTITVRNHSDSSTDTDHKCDYCGAANVTGHTYDQKNTSTTYRKSAATCTSAAVYYYSCRCGTKGTTTFTSGSPIAHTYNQKNTSGTYLKSSATCTSAAVYYYSCTCGAKGTSTFTSGNALGHTWSNATCTTAKTCSRCKVTEGSALGHTWTNATCTTAKTCSRCKVTEGTALGHKPSTVGAVAATCSAPGYTGDSVCSVCQVTLSTGSAIPVLPHTETVINASAATCTDPGYTGDTVCSVCDAQIAAGTEIAAKGHTETLENAAAADCENPGYTGDTVCTVCGETLEEGEPIEALGHDYVSSVTPPTCTEDGYTTHTCSRDSSHTYRDTEVPAKGHVWGDYKIIQEPTHEQAGVMRRVCETCGATGNQMLTIKKLPKLDLQVEFNRGRLILTGIYDDYANKYIYVPEIKFGIVLIPTSAEGSDALTLDTNGRTKIEFSSFKDDGTVRYTFTPAGADVSYSARAFISYKDPVTGEYVIQYSDVLEGAFATHEGQTLTTVPAQAD